jgi:hypothetical protein
MKGAVMLTLIYDIVHSFLHPPSTPRQCKTQRPTVTSSKRIERQTPVYWCRAHMVENTKHVHQRAKYHLHFQLVNPRRISF